MYKRILLVILAASLLSTCKKLSYEPLDEFDDDEYAKSYAWAELVLSEDNVLVNLPETLSQEEVVAATVEFLASKSITLGTVDENNEAVPIDGAVIDKIDMNLRNKDEETGEEIPLCPEKDEDGTAKNMTGTLVDVHNPERGSDVILGNMRIVCAGNAFARLPTLNAAMGTLAGHPGYVHRSVDKSVFGKLKEAVDDYYEEEKNGVLEKYQDHDKVKTFFRHRKMLTGYVKMREALISELGEEGLKDKEHVIPGFLSAFLHPATNIEIESLAGESPTNVDEIRRLTARTAVAGAVAKFLHYDALFDFPVKSKYDKKVVEQRFGIDWHEDLRHEVDRVIKEFNDNRQATEASEGGEEDSIGYKDAGSVVIALAGNVNTLKAYLHKNRPTQCEDIFDDFYAELNRLSLNDNKGATVLFKTSHMMSKTGIFKPCRLENLNSNIKPEDVERAVKGLKERSYQAMENLNKNYSKANDQYLVSLLRTHHHAAAPVITEYPDEAGTLVAALVEADKKERKKEKTDEFWQGFLGLVQKILAVVGLAALALFFLSPVFPVLVGVASILTLVSLAGGAALLAGHGSDWWHERKDYHAVEKAIFSGGNNELADLADTMREWKKAKTEALIEGGFLVVGGVPGVKFVKNPRAFANKHTAKSMLTAMRDKGKKALVWGRQAPGKATKGVWGFVRDPVQTTKAGYRKVTEALSGGWQKASASAKSVNGQSLKGILSERITNVRTGVRETVRNNRLVWRDVADIKELKKLQESIGGFSGYNVGDDFTRLFQVPKSKRLNKEQVKQIEGVMKGIGNKTFGEGNFTLSISGVGDSQVWKVFPKPI